MKKIIQLITCSALIFTMSGCSSKKGSSEFNEYIKDAPALISKYNSFDMNFLFDNPEDFGIKKDLYTLDFMTLENYVAFDKAITELIEGLDDFDYSKLDADQKITYDLLMSDEEENDLEIENQYYLYTNYFDTSSGMQAQLPMSLWNYEFKNQKSYDSFLAILKQLPDLFKKYTDLEKTRQEKGYGMSKTYMEDVIENIHTIATTDQSYILDATFEKIDKADFIAADKKQAAKDAIKKEFDASFTVSFAQAEKDLSAIEIKTKGEGELASYKGGKEYYEQLVSEASGTTSTKEYMKFLDDVNSDIKERVISLFKQYPELQVYLQDESKLQEAMTNAKYTELASASEVIQYLEKTINSGKDFPKIKKLDYVMNTFPESMKDTTTAAAAYFVSAFDDDSGTDEHMILNGTFDPGTFTTLAHESFPGHMYQNNYFKTVDHNILRDLLGSSTYSEGWATYIEGKTCDYSAEPGLCQFENINTQLTYIYVLTLDKKIHYDGITRQEAYTYISENFGIEEEKDLSELYEQLLENPGVFIDYYVGLYRILDLKEEAQDQWDDKYSELRFNKAVLDLGPLPMDLLEKYLELE